jgi:hypothetical protein
MSKKITSKEQIKHIYILSDALYTFREIRENDLSSCASEIERLKLDFDKYLRENQDSEIIGELNRIDAECRPDLSPLPSIA